MSQAHASHQPTRGIDHGEIASHIENAVSELTGTDRVIEIGLVDTGNIERSVFYRDDYKRVYQLNPKEHPGLTGVLDTLFGRIATEHGIDLTRRVRTDGYVIAVSETCEHCTPGEDGLTDDNGETYYPEGVINKLTTCPFDHLPVTCSAATTEELACVHTQGGETLTGADDPRITTALLDGTSPCADPRVSDTAPVSCGGVTVAQQSLDADIAKLIGMLDGVAYVRTHPLINNGTLDQYPDTIVDAPPEVPRETLEEFNEHCEDFLLETAPGWRLRWILEVVNDDPKPLSNIAAAANVALPEAQITAQLLDEWDIITADDGERVGESDDVGSYANLGDDEPRYQLAEPYAEWRDSRTETRFEETEPAYLSENSDPGDLIRRSYQALTSC